MTWHFISTLGLSFKLFYTYKECEMEDERKEIHPIVSASKTFAEQCSRGRTHNYAHITTLRFAFLLEFDHWH